MFKKLSILIPCYNEASFVVTTIQKVISADLGYPWRKK